MKSKKLLRKRLKTFLILSLIVLSGTYTIISMNFSNTSSYLEDFANIIDKDHSNDPIEPYNMLKPNLFGNAPWWDDAFEYRMLINITNLYSYEFINYGVNVTFEYIYLVQSGKMQSDLDDIRIVENGILRKFYLEKDYPNQDMATVWFDTNISANRKETDTYLYFGNPSASNAEARDFSESFGWVKNGDFELDIDTADKYEPYGWTFTHEPVNTILGKTHTSTEASNSSETSYQFFVNKLINSPEVAERVGHGTYAYKWGTRSTYCSADDIVNDYAGTLFSYPFKVPEVKEGTISLKIYRNIRTYRFERPKNMGEINYDGYFIRVINASDYNPDPDTHLDDNIIGSGYENYAEAYDGYAKYNPASKKWDNPTQLIDLDTHTTIKDTLSDGGGDGHLTGYIELDLTLYMGKEIFFEIGAWGDESNSDKKEKSAFFQVDNIKFNYTLTTLINEVQKRRSDVLIIARDVDGRFVSNAKITIVNNSARGTENFIIRSGYTSELDGSIFFENLLNGVYNITANYTLGNQEYEVYNSTKLNKITHNFTGKPFVVDIMLDLWTIDFEVVDWDGLPLKYGYINVSDYEGGTVLKKLILNSQGKTTFRWRNVSSYYYEIYYMNEDYNGNPFLLNASYIQRSNYEIEKYKTHSFNVKDENKAPSSESRYFISEYIYTNGSRTEFGNKKIVTVNISLTNMEDQLTDVSIYYVDKYNSTGEGDDNLLYFNNDYEFNDDNEEIFLDIVKVNNSKLNSEKHEVYGLLIIINGVNSSQCNGIINLNLIETCNVYRITPLARLNIRVISKDISPEGMPVSSLIKVKDDSGQSLINLTSFWERNGTAYGSKNNFEVPFWFFIDRMYNFSIDYLEYIDISFNVTFMSPENQWYPTSTTGQKYYNYTLYQGASLTFNLIIPSGLNTTDYDTAFFNASGTTEVVWGNYMTFCVNFSYTQDFGASWNPVIDPGSSCTITIKMVGSLPTDPPLIIMQMTPLGNGIFSISINSSKLSAGGSHTFYIAKISGNKPGYPQPNTETFFVRINAIPTEISLHDYDSLLQITDASITAYFNEVINITIKYYISSSQSSLFGATLTYAWAVFAPIIIQSDPINNGYYTFTLNTSHALSTGIKVISIHASLENYTTQESFNIFLDIDPRPTSLNGETDDILYLNPKIWVGDSRLFNFIYEDNLALKTVGDLDLAVFSWQELDENGNIINGSEGTGILTELTNYSYSLNFNTEFRQVGFYQLFVTLGKENYDTRFAFINLEIKLREFGVIFDATGKDRNQITVIKGTSIIFELNLTDSTRHNIPLENASVAVQIGDNNYNFTEIYPGYYSLTFNTENIDTFFATKTFSSKIIILKSNFTSQEINVVLNILMEEIFPGMPTFYFILIISSIAGITLAIISYRVIQQARIPKFIKKIRKVKRDIKAKKSISESISIPSKERMLIKLFGEEWSQIGLSLEDILKGEASKSESFQIKNKISEKRGEIE